MSHPYPSFDPKTIDIYNAASIAYWMKEFNVCETSLRNAVFIAGKEVEAVREYLLRRRQATPE